MSLLGYSKIIPYTKFEHFWIIHVCVMLRTNKQTDGLERSIHADRHSWPAWVVIHHHHHNTHWTLCAYKTAFTPAQHVARQRVARTSNMLRATSSMLRWCKRGLTLSSYSQSCMPALIHRIWDIRISCVDYGNRNIFYRQ